MIITVVARDTTRNLSDSQDLTFDLEFEIPVNVLLVDNPAGGVMVRGVVGDLKFEIPANDVRLTIENPDAGGEVNKPSKSIHELVENIKAATSENGVFKREDLTLWGNNNMKGFAVAVLKHIGAVEEANDGYRLVLG